jgi:hypothetical protein
MEDGDYINMNMTGEFARLDELRTRNEFRVQPDDDSGLIDEENLSKINEEIEAHGTEEDQKAPWE